MDAIEKMNISLNELMEEYFKRGWKNVWQNPNKNDDSVVDINEIMELRKPNGLDEVNVKYIEKIW